MTAIQNIHLHIEIEFAGAPLVFSCQVIDAQLTLPGTPPGDVVQTACPDGVVSEPGTRTNGAMTGTVFVDPTATGITWALATTFKAGTEYEYRIVYYADLDETLAIEFTGRAKTNSFTLPFAKPGNARQPLDLALITADMARPVA